MLKYKKVFGLIRLFLGMTLFIYPAYEFFRKGGLNGEEGFRWLFIFVFFLLYAYSSIRNGFRELAGLWPKFNLPRFFEASMNGFISLYLLILIIGSRLNSTTKFLLLFLFVLFLFSMIRDLRMISIQYYDRKQKLRK